ncbi:hypothetical protein [Phycicoccus sp. Root101]|uniref:hypothetical protein n=1 Tax=Phycicoccus sp. Root101 TaxID=1736421 RepID=UPI000A8EC2BC|nr:hypothetical protein [Phycicoccus sp. Root101]
MLDEVAGEYRARVGPLTILRYAVGLGFLVVAGLNIRDSDHPRTAWAWAALGLFWLGSTVVLGRARTVLDDEGVHTRDVRRWRHTRWDEVNFTTSAPSAYLRPADLTLRTIGGKDVATQVPALRWEAVKAYGQAHRTVVDSPRDPDSLGAPPAEQPPTAG